MVSYIEELIQDVADNNRTQLLSKTDFLLFCSISKQLTKNIALTFNQYNLVIRKINMNHAEFDLQYDDLSTVLQNNKLPFRVVDNKKSINFAYHSRQNDDMIPSIAITFPFSKANMKALRNIKEQTNTPRTFKYDKTHFIPYSEQNLVKVVEKYKNMNFCIDTPVQHVYNKIKSFKRNDCIPRISNGKTYNMTSSLEQHLIDTFGEINNDSLMLYKDRSLLYGYVVDDNDMKQCNNLYSCLTKCIATRTSPVVYIKTTTVNFDTLCLSLNELQRKPCLILITKREMVHSLEKYSSSLSNHIDSSTISVCTPPIISEDEYGIIHSIIDKYNLSTHISNMTQIVFVTLSSYKQFSFSNWEPDALIVTDQVQLMSTIKFLKCYQTVDLIINYSEYLPLQLSSFYTRTYNDITTCGEPLECLPAN